MGNDCEVLRQAYTTGMKTIIVYGLFLLLIGLRVEATGDKRPVLQWGYSDFSSLPPKMKRHFIGEHQPLFRRLTQALPEYDHVTFSGSISRIEHELKAGPLTCFPASSNADARKAFTYLTPLYVAPSPVLVMNRKVANKPREKGGKMRLRNLLQDKSLQPLFTDSRSYGPILDKIIDKEYTSGSRQITGPFIQRVADMIRQGRGDYAIEYRYMVDDAITGAKDPAVTIAFIEEIPDFNIQYIACSKTQEGLKIIEKLDKMLQDQSSTPEFKKEILVFGDEPPSEEFTRALDDFIKNRKQSQIIR